MSDWTVRMFVNVPPWVKERLKEAAAKEGMALATFCSLALLEVARDTIGVPKPPDPVSGVPSVTDVLRNYVEGNGRLIGPCGEVWPCGYDPDESKCVAEVEFCGKCGIRVH